MYEVLLKIRFNIKEKLPQIESYKYIGKMIAKSIYNKNSSLKEEHYERKYKPYIFSSLNLKEPYIKGKEYPIIMRTISKEVIENMIDYEDEFGKINIEDIKELNLTKKPKVLITETPTILIKKDRKYYVPEEDVKVAIDLINNNANKKLKQFYNIDEKIDFIDAIKILNNKPIPIKYKNNMFLGNKFMIIPKQDEKSLFLVEKLLGLGLGTKNAVVGAGFYNLYV